MQAEHIPVHLGSMPDAVAAVLGERAAPGRRLDPQRPLPRRHPPARHHPDLARLRRRRAARLRRQPRPPRRRRRPDARAACRPTRRTLEEEGVVIPPTRADDERLARARRADAQPAPAPRRPARPAGRQPDRRAAPARAGRAARARACCAPGWRRSSTTPSAAPAPRWRSSPTAPTRPRTCSRTTPAASRATSGLRVDGDDRRRAPDARLRRHRPAGRRQPQLPALGDQVGGVLRGPGAHRPRRAALGRRLPADRGRRAGGLPAQRPRRRPRSPPATSRPRAGSPTW